MTFHGVASPEGRHLAAALERVGYKLKGFNDLYRNPSPDSGLENPGVLKRVQILASDLKILGC